MKIATGACPRCEGSIRLDIDEPVCLACGNVFYNLGELQRALRRQYRREWSRGRMRAVRNRGAS